MSIDSNNMTVMTSPVFVRTRLREASTDSPSAATTPVVRSSEGWYWSAVRALETLAALPADWDGDGSHAPNARALGVLSVIGALQQPSVPEPSVVPGAGGRIALFWDHQGRRLELHFATPHELGVLRVAEDGRVQETWTPPTPHAAQQHIAWLLTGRDWV